MGILAEFCGFAKELRFLTKDFFTATLGEDVGARTWKRDE